MFCVATKFYLDFTLLLLFLWNRASLNSNQSALHHKFNTIHGKLPSKLTTPEKLFKEKIQKTDHQNKVWPNILKQHCFFRMRIGISQMQKGIPPPLWTEYHKNAYVRHKFQLPCICDSNANKSCCNHVLMVCMCVQINM